MTLAVLAAGCADDGPCDYAVCDISDPACVEAVAVAVACRRGGDVLEPDVEFVTFDELVQDQAPPTPEQLEAQRQYWAGEALVGLMPEGYDPADTFADSRAGVLAFYSPSDERITVVIDDDADARLRYEVMVHEMIHAYQDAEHDLGLLFEEHATTFDRFMGSRATIEGEAELYTLYASLELDAVPHHHVDWHATYESFKADRLERAQNSETPSLDAVRLFPYAWGGWVARQAWDDDGPDAVSDIVANPPDSTREVMRGYTGQTFGDANRDAELAPRAVPVLPGHTYLGGSAQGSWLINAMLQRTAGFGMEWHPFADTVGADELAIFRNDETGEPVAVWRLLLDGGTPAPVLEAASSWWTAEPVETTHFYYPLQGDWVLIAAESTDARALRDSITEWESVEAAIERADGTNPGPIRLPGAHLGEIEQLR